MEGSHPLFVLLEKRTHDVCEVMPTFSKYSLPIRGLGFGGEYWISGRDLRLRGSFEVAEPDSCPLRFPESTPIVPRRRPS